MKGMITPSYDTSFGISLTNPLFILSSLSRRTDSTQVSKLVGTSYASQQDSGGTYVQYEMSIYVTSTTFEEGKAGLPYADQETSQMSWGFQMNEERFEGLTEEQAAYKHFQADVMPTYTFTDAGLTIADMFA